jgi:hypothetical protein
MHSKAERICQLCEHISSEDIHSWSFGALVSRRPPTGSAWKLGKGSLDDEAIFGPKRPYECACGKYVGFQFSQSICDVCGVKITSTDARRTRFGHIDFGRPVVLEVCNESREYDSFPVLPAAIRESVCGMPLNGLYEEMLAAGQNGDSDAIRRIYDDIYVLLIDAAVFSVEWSLRDADTLLKGLGLRLKGGEAGVK